MTDRKKILARASDEEIQTLLSHAYDLYVKSEKTGRAFSTDFLSPLEAREIREAFGEKSVTFFGGYDDAEREIATFGDTDYYDFPISAVEITTKNDASLDHRSCLGTILSLGLKRSGIGDIVIEGSKAIVFCVSALADFIASSLTKIGGTGVKTKIADNLSEVTMQRQYKEKIASLSSMRLDCVVSGAIGKSRSASSALIERSLVFVNYKPETSQSYTVSDGDVVTIRGEGKFLIQTDNNLTRKGRIFVKFLKYI